LKFYLDHWGFKLTDAEFKGVYDAIDYDKDGKISYSDFTKVIGSEIHPGESLYFRQDKHEVV
jgi:Ca2+-binding EF-hand superfamily protein|tara:strand:- start:55 stop:240 length:186 start_codon:yes stop_codon:yes gene_type:complete